MKRKEKHILVLGATGFIGSAFYKELIQHKEYAIHVLVRNKAKLSSIPDNVSVYEGSLPSFNWEELTHFPDVVYHFARLNSSRGGSLGRKWAAFKGNIANKRLLKYLNKSKSKVSLVYLSGSLMYGNSKGLITESNALRPISFARNYVLAEKPFLQAQQKKTVVEVTMVRVPWVLGNGSWLKSFFLDFYQKNGRIPFYGRGESQMSFVFLNELILCLLRMVSGWSTSVVNVGCTGSLTQKEFSTQLAEILQVPIEQLPLKGKYEKAVVEAFESNIQLGSEYQFFNDILHNESLEIKLRNKLPLLLKDI